MTLQSIVAELNENEDIYNILTAIRGPDFASSAHAPYANNMKRLFTQRIRFLAGMTSSRAACRSEKQVFLSEELFSIPTHIISAFRHYIIHIEEALNALLSLEMINKREYAFLISLLHKICEPQGDAPRVSYLKEFAKCETQDLESYLGGHKLFFMKQKRKTDA